MIPKILVMCALLAPPTLTIASESESAPELYDFETILDERDTMDIIHVVGHDREFTERVYCMRGVQYVYESGYTVLVGRNGMPFQCNRIKPDE